ncbi:substrate-binding domain-containing protein [Mycobacterium koreense]|uniref:Uncharacterized protein n=1 Tax=Mycolicibacillus koreensis TaxID=1069220 RepID=A0A7I7SB74_9MYCO|nr:substrate-binding domain-containing protein [Mycolicibacillus koreensis]MCV7246970.1 substrate-binding domain-containing protein [Mycolicibacillus koreensis]OSC35006.1 hypothetical protein B8W67_04200 [Mycolicibacillus koreensis]BBY53559.1 hypothetical protein MKOR_08100 [Mycolicibacillus koreensis]
MGRHSIPDPDDQPDESVEPVGPGEPGESEEPAAAEQAHPIAPEPTGPVPTGAARRSRRSIGEWRGGHRSEGGRRGVSVGVVAALITVVVLVSGVILWRFFGAVLSHRSDTAAARCVAGDETVAVVADPSIADQVRQLAEEFTGNGRQVGDRCVSVSVKSAGSNAVINGFIGDWSADLGERPALWIPASSISAARLQAAVGADTVSDARSLVRSPVMLAVRPELKSALAERDWAALPQLQTTPDALDRLQLAHWGSLRLALPTSDNGDAAALAAEAVATAAAGDRPATDGVGAVRSLIGGQPKLADTSLAEAMNALLGAEDPASAPVHAVVTTEQQLVARAASSADRADTLAGWLPSGPVAVADYPTVLLAGNWLSDEQVSGASEFARYLGKPDQLATFAEAGFRGPAGGDDAGPDGALPDSDVTDFPAIDATVPVGDDSLRATLANTVTAPSAGPATTIMLDQSMGESDGARSRLANVTAALDAAVSGLPADSTIGLWTFDGTEGRSAVAAGPLDTVRDAVSGRLDGLGPTADGAVSFTTLRLVYGEALADYQEGRPNSVLVITTGPHTDRTLDGPGLQDYLRGAVDPARPVAVNVLDFGDDTDRATWEAVAQISGGSYRQLASSDTPELATALSTLLG